MTHGIYTVVCGGGHAPPDAYLLVNTDNELSPCQAYQLCLERSNSEVLIYIHDDVTIHDPEWLGRVMSIFAARPDAAVVGLGGATSLGHPDLYKRPYRLPDMARHGYVSNQTDWSVHGGHETGAKRAAVVDAFFMAIRWDFLVRCRTIVPLPTGGAYTDTFAGDAMTCHLGWPVHHLTHHCLDLWVCCEAARQNKEVWMVGAECTHHGGGSSTKPAYGKAKWLQGGTLELDHQLPHKWLYDEYRDVLPIEVIP